MSIQKEKIEQDMMEFDNLVKEERFGNEDVIQAMRRVKKYCL